MKRIIDGDVAAMTSDKKILIGGAALFTLVTAHSPALPLSEGELSPMRD